MSTASEPAAKAIRLIVQPRPPHNACHSRAINTATTANNASMNGRPQVMAAMVGTARIIAEMTRTVIALWGTATARSATGCAVTTLTPIEFANRILQVMPIEIRPQDIEEHQFGVGGLP